MRTEDPALTSTLTLLFVCAEMGSSESRVVKVRHTKLALLPFYENELELVTSDISYNSESL